MNDGAVPFALRELRGLMTRRPVIAGLIGASVILGVSGPFNTLEALRLFPRLAYWGAVAAFTFGIGAFVSILCERLLVSLSWFLRFLLTTLAIGFAVSCFLFLFNTALFGGANADVRDWIETTVAVVIIAAAIEGGISYATGHQTKDSRVSPAIIKRLPPDKRAALVALTATDHYVEVRTTKGAALILMRMADAIGEAGRSGLQVHRSHWVAHDQIKMVKRQGDRAILTLSDGSEIPVSRSYLPAVRAAGILED